uniref:Uncharacterized protein n=1 Tax=Lepeophtheirus salmonis TaxID=72036 RepID=A0A0K2UWP6_LEPSM
MQSISSSTCHEEILKYFLTSRLRLLYMHFLSNDSFPRSPSFFIIRFRKLIF